MHIEPGIISGAKLALAGLSAAAVFSFYIKPILSQPIAIFRSLIAALFFTLFMQMMHMNVGPSELHFIGAMPMYLLLGFVPTLLGFGVGLLLQGLIFEPTDLMNLAVNALSLVLPLIAVHYSIGKRYFNESRGSRINRKAILKLDALFYTGVTSMVGFWLLVSGNQTPFASWATFAASYLLIVMLEPLLTFATIGLLKRHQEQPLLARFTTIKLLKVAD